MDIVEMKLPIHLRPHPAFAKGIFIPVYILKET